MIELHNESIHEEENEWHVICDDCGKTEKVIGYFEDCVSFMREKDWHSSKEPWTYIWLNLCPDCY